MSLFPILEGSPKRLIRDRQSMWLVDSLKQRNCRRRRFDKTTLRPCCTQTRYPFHRDGVSNRCLTPASLVPGFKYFIFMAPGLQVTAYVFHRWTN
jgi:hypothetical protein